MKVDTTKIDNQSFFYYQNRTVTQKWTIEEFGQQTCHEINVMKWYVMK